MQSEDIKIPQICQSNFLGENFIIYLTDVKGCFILLYSCKILEFR